jgi:uncharacterized protein YndB with AHSA1/START domain
LEANLDNPLRLSGLAHVESREHEGKWQLKFVRSFDHPVATVWRLLTSAEELPMWAPFRPSRDLTDIGPVTLTMIDGEVETPLESEVRTVDPPTLLEYMWGLDLLRWELLAQSEGTTLTLYHTIEDRNWLPKVAAGWHICFDVMQTVFDGTPHAPVVGMDAMNYGWNELNTQYGDILGIETNNQ